MEGVEDGEEWKRSCRLGEDSSDSRAVGEMRSEVTFQSGISTLWRPVLFEKEGEWGKVCLGFQYLKQSQFMPVMSLWYSKFSCLWDVFE